MINSIRRHAFARTARQVKSAKTTTRVFTQQRYPFRYFHATSQALGIPFKLADIGEGIAEVEILQWFVKPGDKVQEMDKICEVQSDKATVEITSRYTGVVESLGFEEGDMAPVGGTLMFIEGDNPNAAPEKPKEEKKSKVGLQRTESMESTFYAPGQEGSHEDPLSRSDDVSQSSEFKKLATPAVRRLVKENGINLDLIVGTGKGGRVLKSDVLVFIQNKGNNASAPETQDAGEPSSSFVAPPPAASTTPAPAPAVVRQSVRLGADETVKIKGIQRQMVKSMTKSLTVPHFNFMDEFEMNAMVTLRGQLKQEAAARGIKLTYLPFLMKAASLALLQYPTLNATVNDDCSEIVHRASHNISVAMDTPRGLLVPNVKDVQNKSIFQVAQDLQELQQLGSENKLGEAELAGGTFSLSNIGTIGGTYASPVIMSPQVAIGAIGKIQKLPRFDDDDQVVAVNVMNISWAADHRIIDGATMARFSNLMKAYIEDPNKMIADMI